MWPKNPYRDIDGIDAFLFAALFVLAGSLFGYFGVHGAILFLSGNRSEAARPVVWGGGLLVAAVMLGLVRRLYWSRDDNFLPSPILLIGAIACWIGAIWSLVLNHQLYGSALRDTRAAALLGAVGVAGVVLWWRRHTGKA
jgi:hypothetical protein